MGIPNIQLSMWASQIVTSQSHHCPIPCQPMYLHARDWMVLTSKSNFASILEDAEGSTYLYLLRVAFVSRPYLPS